VRVLPERVERDAATRDARGLRQRAGRLGVGRHALEHVAEAVAVKLPSLVDPFAVKSREQFAVAEVDRVLQPSLPDEPVELPGVHDDVIAAEPDHVARGAERSVALRSERVPHGDELRSQALAGA